MYSAQKKNNSRYEQWTILKQFYALNYDPSKLCLVGVTGKDTNEIMDWIKECQKDVLSKLNKRLSVSLKKNQRM